MSEATRLRALAESGLLHPNPEAVAAPLFTTGAGFFLAADKVQVKYEMLRAHLVDRSAGDRGGGGARLLAGGVLSGVGLVRPAGDGGVARRAAGSPRAGQAVAGDRGVHPFALRPARARRSPSRWRTGSGCGCTGGPSNGSAAGDRPVVLAAGRGGAGRLRDAARPPARARPTARWAGRCPVRPPRGGRVDRLAGRRAGVRR